LARFVQETQSANPEQGWVSWRNERALK
jgi:hypothetical protein